MTDAQQQIPPSSALLPARLARRGFELTAVALATAAGLFLIWPASGSVSLVFAGLVFAVFLDACTRGLGRFWNVSRGWRLAVVCDALLVLGATGMSFGGYTIAQQADELFATVQEQLRSL